MASWSTSFHEGRVAQYNDRAVEFTVDEEGRMGSPRLTVVPASLTVARNHPGQSHGRARCVGVVLLFPSQLDGIAEFAGWRSQLSLCETQHVADRGVNSAGARQIRKRPGRGGITELMCGVASRFL